MQSNRRIKILYIVDGFRLGGAETKLLELLKHLDRKNYHISICSLNNEGELRKDFENLGAKVKVLGRKHRFDISIIPKLIQFCKREKFDIVQNILFYADVVGTLSAKLAGVLGVISWETISHENESYEPVHRQIAYRFGMKFVDRIVAVSEDVRQSIVKLRNINPGKIITIHYGVNLTKYNNAKRNAAVDFPCNARFPSIAVVARLNEVKGHKYLIEALKKVVEHFPNLKCLFVGDGNYRKDLEEMVREFGLNNNVQFLGFCDNIEEILQTSDLFVLPSISEGLPNALLEAMACSVPVVATSVGGIPEVIKDGFNGILVPTRNETALSEKIVKLAKDREYMMKLGKEGRKSVESHYSLQKQIEEFQSVYNELIIEKNATWQHSDREVS